MIDDQRLRTYTPPLFNLEMTKTRRAKKRPNPIFCHLFAYFWPWSAVFFYPVEGRVLKRMSDD